MTEPVKTEPAKAETLLRQGLFHHRQGQLREAMERYVEVLQGDPVSADALYYIAVVACQEEQFRQGIELGKRALDAGPPQARVHNLIGKAHERLGEPREALNAFDAAIALDATFAEAHGNRANILIDGGLPDEALKSFDRALALKPDSAPDWLNRGALLQALGRPEQALASFDKAIACAPKMAEAHANRGKVLADLRRPDEALASYDAAIQHDPRFADAHLGRAGVLQALGRADEAAASRERATALEAKTKAAPSTS